jgi:hypothetical protein
MPLPTSYSVKVDWNNDGDYSDTGEDITAYFKEIRTERGRDSELQDYQVGNIELRLKNTDGRFSPELATGPLYGNLKPKRKIMVQAVYATITYDIFRGYITKIVPNPSKNQKDCYIYASDTLCKLKNTIKTNLQIGFAEDALFTAIINACLTGETVTTSFDTGMDTYPYAWWD